MFGLPAVFGLRAAGFRFPAACRLPLAAFSFPFPFMKQKNTYI
jgi:hypothetical protein